MRNFFKQNLLTIIGVSLGALTGYFYWKYIGCYSGSCAITSNPLNSTLYGSATGGLIFSLFNKPRNNGKKQ